jgi:hypothetical protein
MALWAAKSFYSKAGVTWPLVWHQGGPISPSGRLALAMHFPDSTFLSRAEADTRVEWELAARGLLHCRRARRRSFMLLKLVDCLLLSRADYLLLLDSDVLFFDKPTLLLDAVRTGQPDALFNRDSRSWYSLAPEVARARYGVEPLPELNAGLGLIRREAWPIDLVERYLADPDILREPWLTEQTANALLAAGANTALLPDTYACSTSPGLTSTSGHSLVAKHYPSHPRPLFFREGIPHLCQLGHLMS